MLDYADSSFLVSRYLADANTQRARDYLQTVDAVFGLTPLHVLEVENAFQLLLFRGSLTKEAITQATNLFRADLKAGRLMKQKLRFQATFRLATELSKLHTGNIGTRSLDVLHVASAKTLNATSFASFDDRQRQLAFLAGLKVVP
jgi:predicted nucleic acid-binding protein